MEDRALLDALLALAEECDLRVEDLPSRSALEGFSPAGSGLCRVRGRSWVLLSPAEPLERRIEILAAALRETAADTLRERYLPPAVRARVFLAGTEEA